MEKQLPQNIEAEKAVLGSIMADPASIEQVIDTLEVSDFYRDAHRIIYGAMCDLYSRNELVDGLTVRDEIERQGQLGLIDGPGTLVSLMNEVLFSDNIGHYATIVTRTAKNRRLVEISGKIAALGYSQVEDAVTKAEELIFSVGAKSNDRDFHGMAEMVEEFVEDLNYRHEHRMEMTGVPSGLHDLDTCTGGFQKSEVIILAARPSAGKTALAQTIALNAATLGKRVAVFSLEMGRQSLTRRFMSMKSLVDSQQLRSGWIEDDNWEKILSAASALSTLPIYVNDTAGNPIVSMRSQLKRLARTNGKIDMVIVDYLGLIGSEGHTENRVQEVGRHSAGLKMLAREFDIPFLVLSQLSRKVEERANKRPQLADLRDSGSVEQDADVVMLLYRDAYYAQQEGRQVEEGKENLAELYVSKQRNGPVGDVLLYFHPQHNQYYGLDQVLS